MVRELLKRKPGMSNHKLAEALNDRGVAPPSGKLWHHPATGRVRRVVMGETV